MSWRLQGDAGADLLEAVGAVLVLAALQPRSRSGSVADADADAGIALFVSDCSFFRNLSPEFCSIFQNLRRESERCVARTR